MPRSRASPAANANAIIVNESSAIESATSSSIVWTRYSGASGATSRTSARTSGSMLGRSRRLDHVPRAAERPLFGSLRHEREVDVRARRVAEAVLPNILDHADDGLPETERVRRELPAERILAGPEPLGRGLRNDHVTRVHLLLGFGEHSAAQHLECPSLRSSRRRRTSCSASNSAAAPPAGASFEKLAYSR